MQSGEAGLAGNIISAQDLEAILTEYLKSIDLDQSRDVARRMITQLRERNFILCYLGADNYAFVHRTFLEFFAAWAFVWEFKETQTLTFEELRAQTFGAHWQEESWQEVLRLIAGMLEPIFVGRTIEFLMAQDGKSDKYANLFLAAECLAEMRTRNASQAIAKTLLDKVKVLTQFDLEHHSNESSHEEKTKLIQEVRTKAVSTVSTIWADSRETLAWLKLRIQIDKDSVVRKTALKQLTIGFKEDSETLGYLKGLVADAPHEEVRSQAVDSIGV